MSATATVTSTTPEIEIEKIIIPEDRHRELNMQRAEVLRDSIFGASNDGRGLLHAVVLRSNNTLVAGLHRIAAFKLEGVATIPYTIKDYDDVDAELAEIDENLIRFDLNELQRSSHVARRMELYKQKYGSYEDEDVDTSEFDMEADTEDTDNPGVRDSAPRTRKNDPLTTKFIRETAELTGKGTTTIRDEAKLGKRILEELSPEVRELIEPTKVAENKRELERLLNIPDPDTQLEVAERVNQSFQDESSKQLSVNDVLAELAKEGSYEGTVGEDGHATLEKSLNKNAALLEKSISRADFQDEAETWTTEGAMAVRDQLFALRTTVEKGIKILDKVIDKNAKLNKK